MENMKTSQNTLSQLTGEPQLGQILLFLKNANCGFSKYIDAYEQIRTKESRGGGMQ